MQKTIYFVYVLRNQEGRLYIGFTNNLERRVRQHQNGEGGWTHNRGPWELAYHEVYEDRLTAMRRERELKKGKANNDLRLRFGAKV